MNYGIISISDIKMYYLGKYFEDKPAQTRAKKALKKGKMRANPRSYFSSQFFSMVVAPAIRHDAESINKKLENKLKI